MATVATHPGAMSALSHLSGQVHGGAKFDDSTLSSKYVAQPPKQQSELWKRSLNPTVGTDGLTAFQRSHQKRQELLKDPRLAELDKLSDKTVRPVREIEQYGLVEQMDKEDGVMGPRQDITVYGPGTDMSRWTGGMSEDEKAQYAHLITTPEQITAMLMKAVHGFEHVDPSSSTYKSLYKTEDGKDKLLKVNHVRVMARHEKGFHNGQEGYDEYVKSAQMSDEEQEASGAEDFGDYHDYDLYDPRGTQMGQVQSLIAARNYWKWAKESGEIPDMVCYGGLFRQWETAQALGDVMVADGYDRPTLICQKDANENGHSGSGVCKIGELDTVSAFMGDKTTWTNNGDQSDAQVITDIAAGLDAEMEAVKQIADSKAARGLFNEDGSVTVVSTIFSSCERMGDRDHLESGQGLANGAYIRQNNADYRRNERQVILDGEGNKIVGPASDVYSRLQVGPGFTQDQYTKIFGKDPLVGHSDTDHSLMSYKSTLRGILPGRETQLNSACTSFRKSMAMQDDKRQQKLAGMLGAADTESITDAQIKTFIKKQRKDHQSRKQQTELAALQAALQSMLSSQLSSRDSASTDTSTLSSRAASFRDTASGGPDTDGRDADKETNRLPSEPVLGGSILRVAQGF